MKGKILTKFFILAVLALVLVPSCFAATVLEDKTQYGTDGAYIYGSTRFDADTELTSKIVYNAGINESKVWVALGNNLNDLVPPDPYYYNGATWYKLTTTQATPVTDEKEIETIEDNLHIFFVGTEMKTVEVPYDGNVDEGSVTDGAKYDKDAKKFVVPALSFDFEFTDNGAKLEVNTNVDTNKKEENTGDDIKEPEIINKDVAAIGDTKYEDLTKAIEAAKDGETVKLLANIDIPTGIEVNKKITVNLNGKTLTSKKDTEGNGIFMVVAGGDLTIEGDGKIDSACLTNDYSMAIWVTETGKLTINGGTFTNLGAKDMEDDGTTANNNELIYVRDNGSAVINGGTFIGNTSNKTYGAGFTLNLRDADRATASILVKGGTFTGFNPADNAAENAGTNFVAEGYKVVADGDKYTVVAYDSNNIADEADLRYFIAKGGTVKLAADIKLQTNKALAIEKDTVLDLNGKTLSIFDGYTKNNVMWTSANLTITGNGTIDARMTDTTYTYAVYAFGGGKVTIENGNFIGVHGLEDYECSLIYCQGANSLITILGGTFVGDDKFTLNLKDADYTSGVANIVVKGGTFTGFNPADNAAEGEHTNFVAEGYKSVKDGDNYKVVAYDANNVTEEAELKHFMTEGGTVKLGSDIELAEKSIGLSKDVVLDLNGHKISISENYSSNNVIWTSAKLTVKGNGTIDTRKNEEEYFVALYAYNGGDITIENGTFIGIPDAEVPSDIIYARGNGSKVTINGGTFIGDETFTLNLYDSDRDVASIIVKGGTFTGFNPANNAAENAGTNFVAEGYRSIYDEATNTYTVKAYDVNNVDDDDSLIYALAHAKEGDTINLAAGNYSKLLIDIRKNVAKNLTLVGTEGVKIAGVNMNGANYGFAPEGLTFKNITFTGDVNVNNTDKWGVICKNLSIIGCTFTNAYFGAGSNSTIDGLKIENNKFNGTNTTNKTSILLQGANHTNVLVKGNTVDGSVHNAVQLAGSFSGQATIEGNTIKNTGSRAIRISTGEGAELTISNNIISNVNTNPTEAEENNGEVIKISGTVTSATAEGNTYNGKALSFVDGIAVAPVEE